MSTGYLVPSTQADRHKWALSGRGFPPWLLYPEICIVLQHCDRFLSCLELESLKVTMNDKK